MEGIKKAHPTTISFKRYHQPPIGLGFHPAQVIKVMTITLITLGKKKLARPSLRQ
jgi:hypothetical protein